MSRDAPQTPEIEPGPTPVPGAPAMPPATAPDPAPDLAAPAAAAPEPVPSVPGRGGRIAPVNRAFAVVAVLAGVALFLSGFSLGRHEATTPGTPASEEQAFVAFWDTYRAVTQEYAGGSVDRKTVIEGAIRGMIESLGDPFSSYMSSEEYRKSLQGISGRFEGIGAQIGAQRTDGGSGACSPLGPTCRMVVVLPIDGSPAARAGLKTGDVVVSIDGTPVDGLTLDDAIARVRGPRGTTVTLGVLRGTAAPLEIAIVRDVIVQKEVETRSLAGGTVGYIKVTGFSDGAADDMARAVASDVQAGQRKLILDLRGNPGGFVSAARRMASQFIASGPIFWQEDAHGNQVATSAQAGGAATDPAVRLVVLIDKGTASAAEIVAGALQDTGRAKLVGETSYGKGTIQEWQPLPDDSGGFRLTIARWLTPNKRWIHKVGLTPDIPVAPAPTATSTDPVLDRALEELGAASAGRYSRAA